MRNIIKIKKVYIKKNTIYYDYDIEGSEKFKSFFWMGELFTAEYNEKMENIPESILIIPLLSNILPICWVNNAIIYCNEIDYTFYKSITRIKKEYKKMVRQLKFKGKLKVKRKVKNIYKYSDKVATFFSGGVDSYSTLITRINEKPDLVTIWGADIDFENKEGWKVVKKFSEEVGKKYELKNVFIKTAIRRFIDNTELENAYHDILNDDWWHAMQHGLGLIGNMAPYAYKYKIKTIYIPSTHSKKTHVMCASNPNIDNNIKFGNTSVIHEGSENTRQDKVKIICEYSKKNNKNLKLRVCYRSKKGDNCCMCEKCYRTMMAIWSQEMDPKNFGFRYKDENLNILKKKIQEQKMRPDLRALWKQIQDTCIENKDELKNNDKVNWIFSMNFDNESK